MLVKDAIVFRATLKPSIPPKAAARAAASVTLTLFLGDIARVAADLPARLEANAPSRASG